MTHGEPACDLSKRTCVPCRGGVPALRGAQITPLHKQLTGWDVIDESRLAKSYSFPDFVTALAFVNRIGDLAEQQGHHPDICLAWGRVDITIWTHKINGLTESDFVLAAKIDELPGE